MIDLQYFYAKPPFFITSALFKNRAYLSFFAACLPYKFTNIHSGSGRNISDIPCLFN